MKKYVCTDDVCTVCGMIDGEDFDVDDKLKEIEIANVQKVNHGEWIFKKHLVGIDFYECSECEEVQGKLQNYCPNCGGKMDGKDGKKQ